MSPRTSERAIGEPRARQARCARAPASAPSDRSPTIGAPGLDDRHRDAAGAAAELEDGSVARARAAARTRRRGARRSARSPSRRTARSRPSLPSRAAPSSMPAGPHPCSTCEKLPSLRPLTDRRKQHRVLDLDECRTGRVASSRVLVDRFEVVGAETAESLHRAPWRWPRAPTRGAIPRTPSAARRGAPPTPGTAGPTPARRRRPRASPGPADRRRRR